MQSAENWRRYNTASSLNGTRESRILIDGSDLTEEPR
jgi:hypothetical protein